MVMDQEMTGMEVDQTHHMIRRVAKVLNALPMTGMRQRTSPHLTIDEVLIRIVHRDINCLDILVFNEG